jgi:hypothetical protein
MTNRPGDAESGQSSELEPMLLFTHHSVSSHLRQSLPSSKSSISVFRQKFCVHFSAPRACYMPFPSHPPWPGHLNTIWWRVQIMKLFIMYFLFLFTYYSPFLRPKYSSVLCHETHIKQQVNTIKSNTNPFSAQPRCLPERQGSTSL